MEENMKCAKCGQEYHCSELFEFDDDLFCEDCLDQITVTCEECGCRIAVAEDAGDDHVTLCHSCLEQYYSLCSGCDALLRNSNALYLDGDGPYCSECYHDRLEEGAGCINSYYFKPVPIFYGVGQRYFGVELEIDDGGECSSKASEILCAANEDTEHVYLKHDGSLEDGFEIVTYPMTLGYHQKQMPWLAVVQKAAALGYRSHQAKTCGLHVHVNRDSLGNSETEQEVCVSKILYFVEKHWEELLKFSRRTEHQLKKWATRYGYQPSAKELIEHAKNSDNGRYSCVNLQNRDTIEFRIFRGTLKYNTLIATLQMVDKICEVAFFMSEDDLAKLSWTSFAESVEESTMPELIRYLKERRIYINEAVDVEEEV